MMATVGIVAGGVCHVLMTALGVMALLKVMPALFNAMLWAGAAYIAWIGVSLMRSRVGLGEVSVIPSRSQAQTFRQGMLTSLLNPKAYLFMLAIFPQFLAPDAGSLPRQLLVLWLIIAATQAAIYGALAFVGDGVRHWLADRPSANLVLARVVGIVLIATAVYTVTRG